MNTSFFCVVVSSHLGHSSVVFLWFQ